MEYIANKEIIAKYIARIFKTGEVVNLGIGLPTLVDTFANAAKQHALKVVLKNVSENRVYLEENP